MNTSAPITCRGVRGMRPVIPFLTALLFATGTLHAQGSAVRVETFSLKPDGEVVIENSRGRARVESWDSQTVRVIAEKKSGAGASIEPGELVLMGAQNSVIVQCRPGIGQIDLTVYVPHGTQLQITGGTFPVEISGTFIGAIVETTSGNIGCHLAPNDDARVAMRSVTGVVRSTMALAEIDRAGTHSLRGQLGTGTSQIILNSQSGNISLAPGPNSSVIAKASIASARPNPVGSPAIDREPGADASARNIDPQQQNEWTGDRIERRSSAGSSLSGSPPQTALAGSSRSSDSSSTTQSGPFVRPRTQRTTSAGDAGLRARIIPSNSPLRTGAGTPDPQQAGDRSDAQQTSQSTTGGQSASTGSTASDPNMTNDSAIFAGSDRASDGSNSSRVGPLERDRRMRTTGGGNSGLRVRIIPAPSTGARSSSSNSVFDNRDDGAATDTESHPTAETSRGDVTSSSAPDFTRPRRSTLPNDSQEDTDSRDTSRRAHPELRRGALDDSSRAAEPAEAMTPASRDEDAILLKAALVNLNVSVTNRAGVALANLKKEDFAVSENGEPQKIEFFQPTSAPFNLVLALDLSGSIKDKLELVKSAAMRFLDVVGPQDKVAVVSFTDQIRVVSQLTSDRDELKRRIKSIDRPQGGTAFYEAMWFALLDTLRGTRGQRNAIVVMTDGVDSSLDRYNPMQSRVTFNQLVRRLEESDVLVFPIYLDTEYEEVFERGNSTSEAYAIARDQLDRLAEVSGGQKFTAEKAGDLSGVYKQVAAALRTVYSVGYYPTNPDNDGTFRRVRVSVNRADAAVRTRKGYYAR